MSRRQKISVIVPFYNEQESLPALMQRLQAVFDADGSADWEALMVDDGSTDASGVAVERMRLADSRFHSITLSRNFGKEAAMLAGFDTAGGDAVVIIDADLQHPPETIPLMVEKWREGYDDVYGRRCGSSSQRSLRGVATKLFYRLLSAVSDVRVGENVGDFRLLDRVCVDALRSMREQSRYTKGMFDYIGFRKVGVDFEQQPRRAGRGKMRVGRLVSLAMNGIVSSGTAPLRWLWALAALLFVAGLAAHCIPPGFPIMALIFVLAALQMGATALLGEYLGRAAADARRRPPYIIAAKDGKRRSS